MAGADFRDGTGAAHRAPCVRSDPRFTTSKHLGKTYVRARCRSRIADEPKSFFYRSMVLPNQGFTWCV